MGALSDVQETSHDTDDSVTVHNINSIKAKEKQPTLLIAGVEELSTGKETAHDIPTTAPTVPSDFLLVNIQGIVPQDTAIILKMGGYKVTRLQGVCVCVVYVCAYESRWVLWVGVCEGYMCTCVGVSGCMSLYCAFLRGVCVYLRSLLTECVCSCCMYILQHCRKWYR